MQIVPTSLPGVVIIEPEVHRDGRGFLVETFHADRYRRHGIDGERNRTLDLELHGERGRQHGAMFGSAGKESAAQRSVRAGKRRSHEQRPDCRALQRWFADDGHGQRPVELELPGQQWRQHRELLRSANGNDRRIDNPVRQEFCLESWNDVQGGNPQPHHRLRNAFADRRRQLRCNPGSLRWLPC